MDNDAFRALVQERSRVKTTKEIAREAVEEEFRSRKKKRKRGGGGGSSSEGENESDSDGESNKHRQETLIPIAAKKKEKEKESKYRDRAKERREGKNLDYQASNMLMEGVAAAAANNEDGSQMDQVTMSKYLGGDETHTHLVKGLDVALARRVKREMSDKQETQLQRTSDPEEDKHPVPIESKKPIVAVRNTDEALVLLQRATTSSVPSELGRQMLSHLKETYLPPRKLSEVAVQKSPAGYAIEKTTLTFSTNSDPLNRNRAWEIPLESMQASSKGDTDGTGTNGAISFDRTLVMQMKCAFSESTDRAERGEDASTKATGQSNQTESEDDDIFDDVGAYVAPSSQPKGNNDDRKEYQSKGKNTSIFDGLTVSEPPPQSTSSSAAARSLTQTGTQGSPGNKNVITRDVLGGAMSAASSKQARTGVSISSYSGGYGEEMDVDFDGRFAPEDDEEGGKKKRRKERNDLTRDDKD